MKKLVVALLVGCSTYTPTPPWIVIRGENREEVVRQSFQICPQGYVEDKRLNGRYMTMIRCNDQ